MNFEKTQSEGLKSTYRVTVPVATVETAITEKLSEISKTVKLPGFRPGKVPMPILKSRFRPQALAEAQQTAMNNAVGQILSDVSITPAVQPSVVGEPVLEDGQDMEFDVDIESMPTIELIDFSTLKMEKLAVVPTDEQIDEQIERLKSEGARPEKIKRNRKLKKGDFANIDFNGKVDGEERPGMKGTDFNLELGSEQFVPGFEKQLIGVKGGEDVQITITFPDDYQESSLQGVEAVFDVTVNEVREKKPLDDDGLMSSLGHEKMEDVRSWISDNLAGAFDNQAKFIQKRKLLDALEEAHTFDLPPSLVKSEFDVIWQQVEADKEAGRLDEDDKDKSDEELREEYGKIAERRVALGLVLSQVASNQSLEITQEELNGALQRELTKYPGQEQDVLKFFQENPAAVQQISAPIMEDKAIEFILEKAEIVEKTVSREELEEAGK